MSPTETAIQTLTQGYIDNGVPEVAAKVLATGVIEAIASATPPGEMPNVNALTAAQYQALLVKARDAQDAHNATVAKYAAQSPTRLTTAAPTRGIPAVLRKPDGTLISKYFDDEPRDADGKWSGGGGSSSSSSSPVASGSSGSATPVTEPHGTAAGLAAWRAGSGVSDDFTPGPMLTDEEAEKEDAEAEKENGSRGGTYDEAYIRGLVQAARVQN
jgi:hypothetical protein